jgi:hypothetical protein
MKKTSKKIDQEPQQVFGDLVLDLYNKKYSIFDIRSALSRLGQVDDWAFIVPRRYVGSIQEPYVLEEMPYDDMLKDTSAVQAVLIYQQYDAVMVKKDSRPLQ